MNLSLIVPPHPVADAALFASLVAAYESDADVSPVVVIDFGSASVALCGAHRIAAAREVYEPETAAELLGWIVVDADVLFEAADEEQSRTLDALRADRVGDFSEAVRTLLPILGDEARSALADQT